MRIKKETLSLLPGSPLTIKTERKLDATAAATSRTPDGPKPAKSANAAPAAETVPQITSAPKEIPPPSDAWRQTLTLTAKWRNQKLLSSAHVVITDSTKWSTCLEEVEGTPFVFVSSGAQSNNLFVIQNTTQNRIIKGDEPATTANTLQIRSAFSAPFPIYHMSIMGTMIATAGPNSRIQLFKIDPNELPNRGKGLEHVNECALGSGKLEEVKLSPPGTRCASVRVHSVQFAPSASNRKSTPKTLLALEGRKAHLWDVEANKVLATETCGHDQLMSTAWSPHAPHGTLFAAAGVDHNLYLLDSRLMGGNDGKSIVWSVNRAHGGQFHGAITSVQFSPFVPYWLASAGEESTTKIWDIRFIKNPMARIDGHYHGVRSLAWSRTHADFISTGSDDRSWRVWSLDSRLTVPRTPAKDMFVGCYGTEWGDPMRRESADSGVCVSARIVADVSGTYGAPVIASIPSTTHLNTFYTLTAIGEVSSHTLSSELFNAALPHRYLADSYPQEYEVERTVHCRDLSSALSTVIAMSRSSLASDRTLGKTEKAIINLCTPKAAISPDSWQVASSSSIGSAQRALGVTPITGAGSPDKNGLTGDSSEDVSGIEQFRSDLESFSYHLPPGFADMPEWYSLVSPKTKTEFEMVVSRFQILTDVIKGDWEAILKAEKSICKGMEKDPTFMEPDTLQLLVETVLPCDFMRGLSMGIRFAEVTEDLPTAATNFPNLSGLFHLLLFPTVYDSNQWLLEPSNLEHRWNDGRGYQQRSAWVHEYLDKIHGVENSGAYNSPNNDDEPSQSQAITTNSAPHETISSTASSSSQPPPIAPLNLQHLHRVRGSIAVAENKVRSMDGPMGRKASIIGGAQSSSSRMNRISMSARRTTLIAGSSLYEAVEDSIDDPVKRKAAIDALCANPKTIISMTRTELAILKLLNKNLPNEAFCEDVIKIVTGEGKLEEKIASVGSSTESLNDAGFGGVRAPHVVKHLYKTTISATTNRLYLDALLLTKRFEEYFQMCIEFVTLYNQFDFSKYILRASEREGAQKMKYQIESMHQNAMNQLSEAIRLQAGATPPTSKEVQDLMAPLTKTLRDGVAVVVKVGNILAQSMETKNILSKEGVEIVSRCIAVLNTSLTLLSAGLFKVFDSAEKAMGKSAALTGAAGTFTRDAASLTIEEIRQAVKGFPRPTDGKTRAFAAALSASTGASVRDSASGNMFMEEVYTLMDKLGRIVKPPAPSGTTTPAPGATGAVGGSGPLTASEK